MRLTDYINQTSAYARKARELSTPEANMSNISKASGPFVGPRGGKWADAKHTIPYKESKHGGKPAPKTRDHDEHGARELQLHIENTQGHQNQHESIKANLVRKIAAGKYDHAQASKLFEYLAESGSKEYAKRHGRGSGHQFDVPTRQAAARQMAHEFHDSVKDGEHDDHEALTGVHGKRAKAGGGLSAMAKQHGGAKKALAKPFTSDRNPNPEGNDRDGDGRTGEKKPFSKGIFTNLPYDSHIMSFYKG